MHAIKQIFNEWLELITVERADTGDKQSGYDEEVQPIAPHRQADLNQDPPTNMTNGHNN
ncbi:MAG: hypothetical protein DDT31_00696 [Syntrophomonadaceae bacterium]|nr:hypothetical protein [Bacillota bacterium]